VARPPNTEDWQSSLKDVKSFYHGVVLSVKGTTGLRPIDSFSKGEWMINGKNKEEAGSLPRK
jgi:hypothetical protein